ncbi:MAG TPA: hypothetical protein V6C57_02785, partial [Coleofasciculaceae cyanobacterium]
FMANQSDVNSEISNSNRPSPKPGNRGHADYKSAQTIENTPVETTTVKLVITKSVHHKLSAVRNNANDQDTKRLLNTLATQTLKCLTLILQHTTRSLHLQVRVSPPHFTCAGKRFTHSEDDF